MQSWMKLMENNFGSNELDADEFNFRAMPDEQASTALQRHLRRLLPP
jgi:hypothetical protein